MPVSLLNSRTYLHVHGLCANARNIVRCQFKLGKTCIQVHYLCLQSWIQIKILMFFGIAKSVRVAKINSAMAEREAA